MYLYLIWLNKCRLSSWYSQLQLMLLAIDRKTRRERGGRRSSDSMSIAGDPEGRSGASWIGQPQDLTRASIAEAVHLARELDGPGPHDDQVVIHAELHVLHG